MQNKIRFDKLKFYPYLFLLPVLAILVTYLVYPIINTFQISLYSWSGFVPFKDAIFTGFKNYKILIEDRLFWVATKNTSIYMFGTLVFRNIFGLTLALALFYTSKRVGKVWRAIIFFPAILSPVIVGYVFKMIFASKGVVNEILLNTGLVQTVRSWFSVPIVGILIITFVSVWQWTGYNMVLYYAGLQSIDVELFEAARLDGANELQVISRIILPSISGIITLVMILNIIGGFKVFDTVYVMTRGGPAHLTEVLTSYAYLYSFSGSLNKMGYAGAISIILTVIILLFTIVRLKMSRED
jgi:raffinose/stachyose/melibiose transport system permease protein